MSDKNNFQVRFASNIVPKVINPYKNKKYVYAIYVSQKHYENDVCTNSDSFILHDEVHESREAAREFLGELFKWSYASGYNDFLDENGKIIDNNHGVWLIEGEAYKVAEGKVVKKICRDDALFRIIDLQLTNNCFEAIKKELATPEHQ